MTTALERLRQTLGKEREQGFVSSVSSQNRESADFHAHARGRVEKGGGLTNFLKNKEIYLSPALATNSHILPEGTDKTDKADSARCARCGKVVAEQNGFRNWFGEPVHLRCGGEEGEVENV